MAIIMSGTLENCFGEFLTNQLRGSEKVHIQYCLGHDFDCRKYIMIEDGPGSIKSKRIASIYHSDVVIILDDSYLDKIKALAEMYELQFRQRIVAIVVPG